MDAATRAAKGGPGSEGAEARLRALGIVLPDAPPPIGNFELGIVDGNMLILSGQGPVMQGGELARGRVGETVSVADAYAHARLAGLVLVSVMREMLGSLDHVERVLKIFGMVNATADFAEHPQVINGCSDLLREIFADRGRHARSAVGVGSLPGNISVEIEATVSIAPGWSGKR